MQKKVWHIVAVGMMTATIIFMACSTTAVPTEGQVVDSISEKETSRADLGKYNPEAMRYTNSDVILYEEPSLQADVRGNIMKFSEVELAQEMSLENGESWSKVKYVIIDHFIEGWIPSEALLKNIGEDFREAFINLDYEPKHKIESYENNPKVQAKAIYVTLNSAITNIDYFIDLANNTQINSFVIDVKNDYGYTLFNSKAAEKYCPGANTKSVIKDMDAFMKKLKDNNIYAIARIVTFKDSIYIEQYPERSIEYKNDGRPYKSTDNLYWGSPHDRNLWEYDVAVAKEAADYGFNEIQFDYVRFPALTSSKQAQLDYKNPTGESKAETIQKFLNYAYDELSKKEVYVAADIYGQVGSVADDMGIGQFWEAVSNEIDYICPMMYPSHYGNGVYGLSVPDAYPYETVFHCTKDSLARNENISTPAEIRPWIQDFTAPWVKGHISYGPAQLKAQIKALEDLGVKQYMIWNPRNRYNSDAVK